MNAIELFYTKFIPESYNILFKINNPSQRNIQTLNEKSFISNKFNKNIKQSNTPSIIEDAESFEGSYKNKNHLYGISNNIPGEEVTILNFSHETMNGYPENNKSQNQFSPNLSLNIINNSRKKDKKSINKKESRIMINKLYESDYQYLSGESFQDTRIKGAFENNNNNFDSDSKLSRSEIIRNNTSDKKAKKNSPESNEQSEENLSTNYLSHKKIKADNDDNEDTENKKAIISSFSDLEELNSLVQSEYSVFSFYNDNFTKNVSNFDFNLNSRNSENNDEIFPPLVDLISSEDEIPNNQELVSDVNQNKKPNKNSSVVKNDKKGETYNKNMSQAYNQGNITDSIKPLKQNSNRDDIAETDKGKNKTTNILLHIENKSKKYLSDVFSAINFDDSENQPTNHRKEYKKRLNNLESISEIDKEEIISNNHNKTFNKDGNNRQNNILFKTHLKNTDAINISINSSDTSSTKFKKEREPLVSNYNSKEGIELITKSLSGKSNKEINDLNFREINEDKAVSNKIFSSDTNKLLKNVCKKTEKDKKEKSKSCTSLEKQINIQEMMRKKSKTKTNIIEYDQNKNEYINLDYISFPYAKNDYKSSVLNKLIKSNEALKGDKTNSYVNVNEKSNENKSEEEEKSLLNKKRIRKEDNNSKNRITEDIIRINKSPNKHKDIYISVDLKNVKEITESNNKAKEKMFSTERIKGIKNLITNNMKAKDSDINKKNKKPKNKTKTAESHAENSVYKEKNNKIDKKKYKFNNILNRSSAGEENNVEINLSLSDSNKEDILEEIEKKEKQVKDGNNFIDFYKRSGLIQLKKDDIRVVNYPYNLDLEKNLRPKSLLESYFIKKLHIQDKFVVKVELFESKSSDKNFYIGYFNDLETGNHVETEPMESYSNASQRIHQLLLCKIFDHQIYYWEIVEKIQLM